MTTPNCRGTDTDLFYTQDGWPEAKKICKGCPIMIECRREFVGDEFAYAGGMTPTQRQRWHQGQPEWKPKPRTSESNKRITDETKVEVVRLFDEEDLSQEAISRRTGVSKSAVRRILHFNGRIRTMEQQKVLSRRRGEETRGWITKLLAEDYTNKEIADKVGVSVKHVADTRRNCVLDQEPQ